MIGGWIEPDLLRHFDAEGTNAHRLCTATDGWVERFGRDILVSFKNQPALQRLSGELKFWADEANLAIGRVFARLVARKEDERQPPALISGDPRQTWQTIATERHIQFKIDLAMGFSPGLFLDQRENRSRVRQLAPRRLLNCFAYTCSFSVCAASRGALTFNVDLSSKYLARGRENFALNSLPTRDHRFIADDVRAVLPRLARRGEKFDAIILDPPTFSRSRGGKTFRIQEDFEKLLIDALQVAERDGHVLLSTNCSALREHALEVMARYCLNVLRRAASFYRTPSLPDFPPGAAASSVWLTLR